jgi:hypothetical protein
MVCPSHAATLAHAEQAGGTKRNSKSGTTRCETLHVAAVHFNFSQALCPSGNSTLCAPRAALLLS